jgi:hypothetical protein
MLEPTIADALRLVNAILADVNTAYPGFETRFGIEDAPRDEESNAAASKESA